jgi:C1A family cysteine protease
MKYNTIGLIICLLSNVTFAEMTHVVMPSKIPVGESVRGVYLTRGFKIIGLIQAQFTNQEAIILQQQIHQPLILKDNLLPHQVELGMNQVPVFDQGIHGTCATFSTISALDALKGQGDYYSQLCLLNLGKTLAKYGFNDSGWDGTLSTLVLGRAIEFGLVSKQMENLNGCGGAYEYPTNRVDKSGPISIEDYHLISENLNQTNYVNSKVILTANQKFSKQFNSAKVLNKTREALHRGHRVLVSIIAPFDSTMGIHGKHHVSHDSWVLSDNLSQLLINNMQWLDSFYWHAMVITGYDDDAKVVDINGKEHIGLFKVRNSWGEQAGDAGDYYLSYDFFENLVVRLTEVM